MKKVTLLFLILFLCGSAIINAQDLDPTKTAKGLLESAYKNESNIEIGFGVQRLVITDASSGFFSKANFIPNTYEYYISYPSITKFEHSDNYMIVDFRLGKRIYSATPSRTDTVSIDYCESMQYYFLGAAMLMRYKFPINKHMAWSINPGMYVDLAIGDLKDEITNGSLTTSLEIVGTDNFPQNMRSLDFGMAINTEIAVHAAYFGLSFRQGFRNLAPKDSHLTIRNNAILQAKFGYRFASTIAKQDKKKVEKFVPKLP